MSIACRLARLDWRPAGRWTGIEADVRRGAKR